jgi:eukaryotic-like serine/threonine-protein kinase
VSIGTGTKLGQYEVQDFIGQGAMGLVYRAYHAQLARTGAVKVMQAISPDDDSIARFRREAQAIAQMRHPNILNVFDFGEYEGTPYMIVEYVPGGSLAGRIKHAPMDVPAALEYLDGIASGLDYAHSLGIVHRDVKPANVLLEKDGTPVIADFGLAKLLQSASVKSMTGVTTGTPAYMAPEQVTGSQVGPAADRYSMATMAYEMLTGSIPFDDEGVLELLYAQVHRDPPTPSSRRPELGSRVDAVVMRGLAKDPSARWESCGAFVIALRQALAGATAPALERTVVMAAPLAATMPFARASAPATSAGAVAVAATPVPITAASGPIAAVAPIAPARRSHRTRYRILAGAGILLLLAVLFLLYAATRPPALLLSASSVTAGDHVVISATHVPANQVGEIQLNSPVRVFPFKADGTGNVSVDVVIPRDIGAGDHIVAICWNNTCHAQTTLHVTAPLSFATPSPNPTPSSSASPASRLLALSSGRIKVHTGTMTVRGIHFSPGQPLTLTFIQGTATNKTVATTMVGADGTFLQAYTIPSSAVVGPAFIRACDESGCGFASISVTAS